MYWPVRNGHVENLTSGVGKWHRKRAVRKEKREVRGPRGLREDDGDGCYVSGVSEGDRST